MGRRHPVAVEASFPLTLTLSLGERILRTLCAHCPLNLRAAPSPHPSPPPRGGEGARPVRRRLGEGGRAGERERRCRPSMGLMSILVGRATAPAAQHSVSRRSDFCAASRPRYLHESETCGLNWHEESRCARRQLKFLLSKWRNNLDAQIVSIEYTGRNIRTGIVVAHGKFASPPRRRILLWYEVTDSLVAGD